MDEEMIGREELAALSSAIEGVRARIPRRLRPVWRKVPPEVESMVCAALADLVRDPHGIQLAMNRQGDPQCYEHLVLDLQGIEVLFASELRRLRALVARYHVPDLTAALLADPEARRTVHAWLAETRRR